MGYKNPFTPLFEPLALLLAGSGANGFFHRRLTDQDKVHGGEAQSGRNPSIFLFWERNGLFGCQLILLSAKVTNSHFHLSTRHIALFYLLKISLSSCYINISRETSAAQHKYWHSNC